MTSPVQTKTNNFFEFYCNNQQLVDYWISLNAKSFEKIMSVEDIRQNLIVRLNEKEILKNFDQSKSKLSSYIINQIKWEINHIISPAIKRNTMPSIDDTCQSKSDAGQGAWINDFFQNIKEKLSENEQKILSLVIEGYSQIEISKMAGCSRTWISCKIKNIRKKTLHLKKDLVDA